MLADHPLALIGLAVILGYLGERLMRRLRIPQVVGAIIIGLFLGLSMRPYNVIGEETINALSPLICVALGFIGFNIGGELRLEALRELGKHVIVILFFESFGAFFAVTLLTYVLTNNFLLALILGALSSATAPAATVDVIYEYKSRGPLTLALIAIVGLDDAVALIIYAFVYGYLNTHLLHIQCSMLLIIAHACWKIFLSLAIGALLGLLLTIMCRKIQSREEMIIASVGIILLGVGVSQYFSVSEILTSMAIGAVLSNVLSMKRAEVAFDGITSFMGPFIVLFFVLIGAKLDFRLLLIPSVLFLAITYILARSTGKILGVKMGAAVSKAPPKIGKYLGYCLFSQAGVAVGLAFTFYRQLLSLGTKEAVLMANLIINVIASTTLVVQIIGPPFVKYGLMKAGEIKSSQQ
ncbi:MAG: cation:proton antiporter [Thermoplasmata archaeon]|nr:MAG: cation:proton antiporter [Thermoplasmata archaeon]